MRDRMNEGHGDRSGPGLGKTGWDEVTPLEIEALRAVAEGGSTQAGAERLCLSYHTVKKRMQHLREKTGCRRLPRLLLEAMRHGLLSSRASEGTEGSGSSDSSGATPSSR